MEEGNFDSWAVAGKGFLKQDYRGVEAELEAYISRDERAAFKTLIGKSFSNSGEAIVGHVGDFVRTCRRSFDLRSVYLEMNGFDINPDRWYFDLFGYESYRADSDDLEWLCEMDSSYFPDFTLTGLEEVQKEFDWYHRERIWKDKSYRTLYDTAMNLVMTKFVLLIQGALHSNQGAVRVPLLATAHDFDTVGRFEPKGEI